MENRVSALRNTRLNIRVKKHHLKQTTHCVLPFKNEEIQLFTVP